MSLHVIQQPQQTNVPDWRWQMAANFLMPLVTDAIQGQRQRDANRKQNAMAGEVLKQLAELQGGTTTQQSRGLQGLPEPEGYNSNGWTQVFHQQGSPLAQMDAGLLPPSTQGQQRIPTQADIQKVIAQTLVTPRFSMLDPKAVQEYLAPMLQANEAARKEAQRQSIADQYMNATDARTKRDALMYGAIQQIISENLANMGQGQYVADRPQYAGRDLGGSIQDGYVDTTTGTFTPTGTTPKTLNPQQVGDNAYRDRTFAETVRANRANEDYRDRQLRQQNDQFNTQIGYNRETRDLQREDARRVAEADFSSVEKTQMAQLEAKRQGLIQQQTALMTALGTATTDQQRAAIQAELDKINVQLNTINNRIDTMYRDKLAPARMRAAGKLWNSPKSDDPLNDDIGAHMTGNAHGGVKGISTPYKTIRVKKGGDKYTHYGVDYMTPNGTEILVPDIGVPLTVSYVGNQPDGYGHHVKLTGQVNGHRVDFTIAHMQDGVNVKRGDTVGAGELIGLSGNSGNSRGKNGGYHMHLEVKVDGEYVDPTKARAIIRQYAGEKADSNPATPNNPSDIPPVAPEYAPQGQQQANGEHAFLPLPNGLNREDVLQMIEVARNSGVSEDDIKATYGDYVDIPLSSQGDTTTVAQAVNALGNFFGAQPAYADEIDSATEAVPAQGKATLPPSSDSSVSDQIDYYASQPMPEMTDDMELAASLRPSLRRPVARHTAPARQTGGRTSYAEQKSIIDGAAQKHGIDNELIQAIIEVESTWKPNARSKAGAMGLMQLMPATAHSLGVRNAYDPAQNVEGGSRYIAQLIRRYGGDVSKALMAYNCGPGNVAKGRIPQASRNYAQKVMNIYNRLKGQRTAPTVQPQTAPDGGNISWLNSNGQPAVTSSGQPFTDETYRGWVNAVNAGEYRDVGLNSQADLDRWLESRGMRMARPAEEQGLSRLNSGSRGSTEDVYDANIAPLPPTPQNSPTLYPAPYFTDEINGTRAQDTQAMLDALNGITRGESSGWSSAFHDRFGAPALLWR
ncbi:MAG: transglycosylase SLT domain-containing protein [Synergistaceae bacterium]|nr:transglycosylase SLT domain-containing protein [Synergistaceae bacterium]